MPSIQLRIEGDNAEELSQALQQKIINEWGIDAPIKQASTQQAADSKDWATIAAVASGAYLAMKFVIDLPKFLDAVSDLEQRFKAKQHVEQLVEWTEDWAKDYVNNTFVIEVNGIPFPINTDNLVKILNAIQQG